MRTKYLLYARKEEQFPKGNQEWLVDTDTEEWGLGGKRVKPRAFLEQLGIQIYPC